MTSSMPTQFLESSCAFVATNYTKLLVILVLSKCIRVAEELCILRNSQSAKNSLRLSGHSTIFGIISLATQECVRNVKISILKICPNPIE